MRLNYSLLYRLLLFIERDSIFIDDCIYEEDFKARLKELKKSFSFKLRFYLKYILEKEEILFYHINHLIEEKYIKPKSYYPNKDWQYEEIGLNFLELSLKGNEYLKETRLKKQEKVKSRLFEIISLILKFKLIS